MAYHLLPRLWLEGCPSNLAATFTRYIDTVNALLVDLDQTGARALERYLGKEGASFFRVHGRTRLTGSAA